MLNDQLFVAANCFHRRLNVLHKAATVKNDGRNKCWSIKEKIQGEVFGIGDRPAHCKLNAASFGGLTFSLFFFSLSFFFQGVLCFFLCLWLLSVGFFAHAVLLDVTCFHSTASLRIVNRALSRTFRKAAPAKHDIIDYER